MDLNNLKQTLPFRAMAYRDDQRGFKTAPKADHFPIRITGGIGDLILGCELAIKLQKRYGDVIIYSKWPDIARYFSGLTCYPDELIRDRGFDFFLSVNGLAFFQFAGDFEGFPRPELRDLFLKNREFLSRGSWTSYAENHPHLDCMAARDAIQLGLNRRTLPLEMLGLDTARNAFSCPFSKSLLRAPYVTVHDGFDTNTSGVQTRSTKNWLMKHWIELVEMLQGLVKVVQIGGPTSRPIPGVDFQMVNKCNFQQSLAILRESGLHIDGDSGVVHAAWALGVQSVVMFGPTPHKFFGHSENRNLAPERCGDCWWVQPDWMSKCPVGYGDPVCMDSISPERVYEEVMDVLFR